MNYEELLAKIDEHIDYGTCGVCDGKCYEEENIPWLALRAVVELHKPVSVIIGDRNGTIHTKFSKWQCKGCYGEYNQPRGVYPCPTIQAIEEELQ